MGIFIPKTSLAMHKLIEPFSSKQYLLPLHSWTWTRSNIGKNSPITIWRQLKQCSRQSVGCMSDLCATRQLKKYSRPIGAVRLKGPVRCPITSLTLHMDKRKALSIARQYKRAVVNAIGPAKVYLFGSYSKGCARPDSDIDIAVVVPFINGDYLSTATHLWRITMDVNTLIEPVLIEEAHPSPLYDDILQTGIAV